MTSFALITEGVTDQAVLDNILCGYFGEDNIEINPLQPLRQDKDSFGNWLNVFDYCSSPKLTQSLQVNDYVIIQIDTDVSEEVGYDIPKYVNKAGENREKTVEQMIDDVKRKLIDILTPKIHQKYQSRIIFAICVDSLECWLLPLVNPTQSRKVKGCLKNFQHHLTQRKKTRSTKLDKKLQNKTAKELKKPKTYNFYDFLSQYYLDSELLKECSQENPSFSIFMQNLQNIDIEE